MSGAAVQVPELDHNQRRAVQREGQDVCVVAGPGSGKTRVLVERFAWLVDRGLDPARILAITFTEKAATEIRARLAKRFAGNPDALQGIQRAQISTIHGFCHTLLRQHAIRAGLDPRFEVMDDVQAEALRRQTMQAVLDQVARQRPEEFLRLASAWPAEEMASPLLALYEAIRVSGTLEEALRPAPIPDPRRILDDLREELAAAIRVHQMADRLTEAAQRRLGALLQLQAELDQLEPWQIPERAQQIDLQGVRGEPGERVKRVRDLAGKHLSAWAAAAFAPQRQLLYEILAEFDAGYRTQRSRLALADFLDLEEMAFRLLDSDAEIRRQVQESYEHILMDELQDTNPIQWKILARIRRPGRFFAVGDVNQSIYGFRFAAPSLFNEYEEQIRRQNQQIDRLEVNYRTRPEILEAVRRILIDPQWPNKGIRPHQLVPGRDFPGIETPCIEILCADAAQDDVSHLHLSVAARLRSLYGVPLTSEGRAARFSDMAVFVRNSNSFAEIERALQRFSIPYVISGGRTFFDSGEVIDLVNLLRALASPHDEIALFALLRSPFFGISDEELFQRRLRRVLLCQQERTKIESLRAACAATRLSAVFARFLDESGYAQRLDPQAAANVAKFLGMLDALESRAGRSLPALLEELDHLRASSSEANAPALEAGDAVQLMTIHKAKGLEFPIVAVAALDKRDPADRAPAAFDAELGLGFQWRLTSGQTATDPALAAIREARSRRDLAERDRLLYVAFTRAKERLILSFVKSRNAPADRQKNWSRAILDSLGLPFPSNPGEIVHNGLAILTRVAGAPEIPPAPEADRAAPAVTLERLPEPPRAPTRVSVTALALFAQCPRRYLLGSDLGWLAPPGGHGGAIDLGTEVHEYLAGVRTDVSPEAKQLAEVFQQSQLALRSRQARQCQKEMDFLVEIGGILVHGQIDLWFDDGAGPVIVDYKSDQYLSEARLRGYELQLRLYALALARMTGRSVSEAWLFPLREGQPHPVDISAPSLETAITVLAEWREASVRGEFAPRQQPDCQWCPFAGNACTAPWNLNRQPEL